ncbi:MAG: hypothetical protein ACI93R_003577 [Flavobacteriales bacterium]|jgi:hypothetical protein
MILKIVAIIIALSIQLNVVAGELFVNKKGDGDICSYNDPCRSIQTAIDKAVDGDIIVIARGKYHENLFIQTPGITLQGKNKRRTIITTAGGREGALGNAGNPLDAIIEVRASNVAIRNLTIGHPVGVAIKREAAIFAWKGSPNLHVVNSIIARKRTARTDEPTVPGSRGIFIFAGPGSVIEDNMFIGNYQDHVHLPSNEVIVRNNRIAGASRSGVSVMDPVSFVGPDVFNNKNNVIENNFIRDSLSGGIHIQGDETTINNNVIVNSDGYGIYLCGEGIGGACFFPGEEAVSEGNLIGENIFKHNTLGEVGDFGVDNIFLYDK